MKSLLILPVALATVLAGCQNLPDTRQDAATNVVYLKATHCLEESVGDQNRIHFGPCLKITDINGAPPAVRENGFIELPVARPLTIGTTCVYRHADGSPIPATVGTAAFQVSNTTFQTGGKRWYLHAHEQARGVIGCKPTLSTSQYPTRRTD